MEKEEGRRRERPWDDQQLAMVSKKELIEWLQQNASNSFLKKHGLQGKVANVAKKNKKVLDESFRALFEEGASEDSFRQEKDEEETKVYRETFCRPKVRSVRPLKLLMLNFVGMNIKVYHKALLKFLPNVPLPFVPPITLTLTHSLTHSHSPTFSHPLSHAPTHT